MLAISSLAARVGKSLFLSLLACSAPLLASAPTIPEPLGIEEAIQLCAKALEPYGYELSYHQTLSLRGKPPLQLDALDRHRKLGLVYLGGTSRIEASSEMVRNAEAAGYTILQLAASPSHWEIHLQLYELLHKKRPSESAARDLLGPPVPGFDPLDAIKVLASTGSAAPLIEWLERHDPRSAESDEPLGYLGAFSITALGNMRAAAAEPLLLQYFQEAKHSSIGLFERITDALARIRGQDTLTYLHEEIEIDWIAQREPPMKAVLALNLLGRMRSRKAWQVSQALLVDGRTHEQCVAAFETLKFFRDEATRGVLLSLVASFLEGSGECSVGPAIKQLIYFEFSEPPAHVVELFENPSSYNLNMDSEILIAVILARAGYKRVTPFLLKRFELSSNRLYIAYGLSRLGMKTGLEALEREMGKYERISPLEYSYMFDLGRDLELFKSALE